MKTIKFLIVTILTGLAASIAMAGDKGFPMYSQEKRDVSLIMSDRISRTEAPLEMKRVIIREVPVETKTHIDEIMGASSDDSRGNQQTHALFEVQRGAKLASKTAASPKVLTAMESRTSSSKEKFDE